MRKILITLVLTIMTFIGVNAQTISPVEKDMLRKAVVHEYNNTQMEGCYLYKLKRKYLLISIVSAPNNQNSQRIAQIKSARAISEYLNSARNKSVSAYVINSDSGSSINEDQYDDNSMQGKYNDSQTVSNVNENNSESESMFFTDKIVQSSFGYVKHMQCLKKIPGSNSSVYIYFTVL